MKSTASGPWRRPTSRGYLLVMLASILALSHLDRIGLGLALQSIKGSLHLSDSQLGLLSGLAFAVFYAMAGIPIGRWADRGNRVTIISLTTTLWSILVALSGWVGTFGQLLLIRVCVGVGEAGCTPPAYSLISDAFSRTERARAFGIYWLGVPASSLVGYFCLGWVNQLYGWRVMFMVIGVPGLAMAALAALTMREPRAERISRKEATSPSAACQAAEPGATPPTLLAVFRILLGNRTYRHLLLQLTVTYLFSLGILQWQPAFFIRSYHLSTGYLGTWFAISLGLGGLLGDYLGGYWASRYAANREPLQLQVLTGLNASLAVITACVYLTSNYYVSFALIALANFVGAFESGPSFAAMQAVVPERVRGVSISLVFFFANLIGTGLGPLAVGIISQSLHPIFGSESLRYALVAMCPGYFWGAWHLWRASRSIRRDIDIASKQDSEPPSGVAMGLAMAGDPLRQSR